MNTHPENSAAPTPVAEFDSPPETVRFAAMIGIGEGAVGLGYASFLLVRSLQGFHDPGAVISGWGTALWFILIFGAVLAASIALLKGRRWGRAPLLMMNLFLVGIAYYMFTSDRVPWAVGTALLGLVTLGMLFNRKAVDWAVGRKDAED